MDLIGGSEQRSTQRSNWMHGDLQVNCSLRVRTTHESRDIQMLNQHAELAADGLLDSCSTCTTSTSQPPCVFDLHRALDRRAQSIIQGMVADQLERDSPRRRSVHTESLQPRPSRKNAPSPMWSPRSSAGHCTRRNPGLGLRRDREPENPAIAGGAAKPAAPMSPVRYRTNGVTALSKLVPTISPSTSGSVMTSPCASTSSM